MLDVKALQGALSQLTNIGRGTTEFQVGGANGVSMTLRTLDPDEDKESFRYAKFILDELSDEEGKIDAGIWTDYLDRFKVAVLSYSIIRIGNTDLNERFIVTDEIDDNGNAVRRRKHEVMRKVLRGEDGGEPWSRDLLKALFKKYAELVERVELAAEKSVEYDPVDIDAEITRLEKRLKELQEKKELRGDTDREDPLRDVLRVVQAAQDEADTPVPSQRKSEAPLVEDEEEQQTPPPPPPQKQEVVPRQAPPPRRQPTPPQAPAPSPRAPSPPQDPHRTADLEGVGFDELEDSMLHAGEDEATQIARENARLMRQMQARRAQAPVPPPVPQEEVPLDAGPQIELPPDATDEQIAEANARLKDQFLERMGRKVDGDDAGETPATAVDISKSGLDRGGVETISPRRSAVTPPPTPDQGARGGRNPNFRGNKKR